MFAAQEAAHMPKRTKKLIPRKIVLRLPDLDHAKSSVLNSLSSPRSRRNYKFAMEQFITWYCSEPRLALNRTVVLRFRLHLESLGLAAGTINQRLAAVRRLAYEAADSGLLSPELAAGIRRVKGVKQLGCRAGNWLNREQARLLLETSDGESLRSIRDVAMMSILVGCGLRRAELAALRKEDIQVRQGHWAIVDLVGKGTMFAPFPCRAG
jgi:site-specific recombinase XerC